MCGIAGIAGLAQDRELDAMLDRLIHRGPDDRGMFRDAGVAIGMRRLAVIDPAGGRQPIFNEDGTVAVVLNGEIYNYRELRAQLIAKGHRFTSATDTEVLVHLYEEEGDGLLEHLRGMFVFALWDRRARRLLLARDPLGIKPIYYTIQDGRLLFASELPAMLAVIPRPSLRPAGIAQYLNLLYVPGPETLYAGIRQLDPGERMVWTEEGTERRRYFDLGAFRERIRRIARPPRARSAHEEAAQLRDALRESVEAHLVSDVPLGLFLSGGLDSGCILAMMRSLTNGTIRTFSIGYEAPADGSYSELELARRMAQHFGTEHVEHRLAPQIATLLPAVVSAMGEPFADSSAIATYLVSQTARRDVTVALSGIGGDEAFGGYPRYAGLRLGELYAHVPSPLRRWAADHIASRLKPTLRSRDHLGRLRRFLEFGAEPLASQYIRWTTFLPAVSAHRVFEPDFAEAAGIGCLTDEQVAALARCPGEDWVDRAMLFDSQTYLPDDLLRMGDRLSMAHSLELRVPFCDRRLLAAAFAVPSVRHVTAGHLKRALRAAMRDVLPPDVIAGKKYGFMVPIARWLRDDLGELVEDLLSETSVKRRGYVRPAYVSGLVAEHRAGRANHADRIYALLVFELWHRQQAGAA